MIDPSTRATTYVKICGVRDAEGLDAAVEAGATHVGFTFVPGSRRWIAPEAARALIARLPTDGPLPVGVFRDQPVGDVSRIARAAGVRALQLHGAESAGYLAALPGEFELIKAVTLDDVLKGEAAAFVGLVDLLLVDGRRPGSGETWDFAALAPHVSLFAAPILIAGGLDAENVGEALRASGAAGADVASGVEVEGAQRAERIRAFVNAALAAREG